MTRSGRDYLELDDRALVAACEVDLYRASGPGGQKRNKTCSAVRFRHRDTGVSVIAEDSRSQHENRRKGIRRLRLAIALAVRCDMDLETYAPSERVRSCITGDGRIRVAQKNESYPFVVSEVLDLLCSVGWKVSEAAAAMGVSTAELVKFIERDPRVWKYVNEQREQLGLRRLR